MKHIESTGCWCSPEIETGNFGNVVIHQYEPYQCSCCGFTNGDMFEDWLDDFVNKARQKFNKLRTKMEYK